MTTTKIFKKLRIKDRDRIKSLIQHSPTAYAVWSYLYLCTDKDDCCTESRPEIEKATMMSHNTVDNAIKLLRDQKWLVATGYVPIEDGKWVVKHRVQVGFTIPKNWVEPKAPKNGDSGIPKKRGTTVDHHVPVSVDSSGSGESVLGGGGGVSPPSSPKAKQIAKQSTDGQDVATVDAPSALQQAAAATSADTSTASQSWKPNPNTVGRCPTPHRGSAPEPRCQGTGVSGATTSKPEPPASPKPSWMQPYPAPQTAAERLAVHLYRHIQGRMSLGQLVNGKPIFIPKPWLRFWSEDFQKLLDEGVDAGWDASDIEMVIWYSQMPKQQEYYVRSQGILSNWRDLHRRMGRRQASFRSHACKHEGCICLFSNSRDYNDHLTACHEAAPPPPDKSDAEEEESSYVAEDIMASGTEPEADPPFDPFADSRTEIDYEHAEEVTGLPVGDPGREWVGHKITEDWGDRDMEYELPEPFTEPAKGSIRPDGETSLPDFLLRSGGKVIELHKETRVPLDTKTCKTWGITQEEMDQCNREISELISADRIESDRLEAERLRNEQNELAQLESDRLEAQQELAKIRAEYDAADKIAAEALCQGTDSVGGKNGNGGEEPPSQQV